MSNLTIDSLMKIYDGLPKLPPLPEAIIIPQRIFDKHVVGLQASFNNMFNMQAELFGIKVYVDLFPRHYLPKRVFRSRYKTRAGFKHARLYWRSIGKKMQRAEEDMMYLLSTTAKRTETEFVARVPKQY